MARGSTLLFALLLHQCRAFVLQRHRNPAVLQESSGNDDRSWQEALQRRQRELTAAVREPWRSADCETRVACVLPNWVRRVAVDYPFIACGSASGTIYVGNLELQPGGIQEEPETGLVAVTPDLVDGDEHPRIAEATRLLFGSYDGGGTLAVAMSDSLIVDSRRDGGLHLWRFADKEILRQGKLLDDELVLSVTIHNDLLWVGTLTGGLNAYALDDDTRPLSLRSPIAEWSLDAAVISISVCDDLDVAVVATASGSVQLLSTDIDENDEDRRPLGSFYPPWDSVERRSTNSYALSAVVVPHADNESYSVVCGGTDGSVYVQPLNVETLETRPFTERLRNLKPRHLAAVPCLASPAPGMVVTGGRDGRLRMWELAKELQDDNIQDDSCLYQFVGYKVWLGSMWTDGKRLVTDGSDNTVLMHMVRNLESETSGPVEE